MPPHENRRSFTVRALLKSTQVPFEIADYQPQALIFRQGDPCDSVLYIENGGVRLTVAAPDGREAVYGLLGVGAFLGEEALAGRPVRGETAIAMTATEVLVVDLAGCRDRGPHQGVLPVLSQEVLAEMVGTTRSRVNVFMGKFKKLGLIEQIGGVLQVKRSLFRVVDAAIDVSHNAHPAWPLNATV